MTRGKKTAFLLVGLGIVILGCLAWVVISDARYPADLPAGVTPLGIDMTTSYLIPVADGYMMVDTNYSNQYATFKEGLHSEGIDPGVISFVFLTHHHDDHAGFVQQLVSEFPHIRVILHERSIPYLARGRNNTDNPGGLVNPLVNALFHLKKSITPGWDHHFPAYQPRETDVLLRGDREDLSLLVGRNVQVLYTPGHTDDSLSLVLDGRYLFAGDLASNFLNWAGTRYLTIYNEDLLQVYESWRTVLDHGVEVIIPAHGRVFQAEALARYMYGNSPDEVVPYKPY